MRGRGFLNASAAVLAMMAGDACISAAFAQDAPAPAPQARTEMGVEDIVVTARRKNELLRDVPVAITAVGGETLNQYSVNRVADIATLVPSLIAGKAASGSSASIFLRGVGSTALSAGFDQSVSFVIDGLPMSRGREISLPQYDIQRVEVLKGPQALFFGKNTTGGLISVTTNGPTSNFQAGAKAGYGFKAEEKYVEAYVSGPLSDTLRARIAGRYSKAEGAFTNTAQDVYTQPGSGIVTYKNSRKRGFSEAGSGRVTVDWQPVDWLKLELKTGMTKMTDGGPTDLVERLCGSGRTTPLSSNGIPPSPNTDCSINGRSDMTTVPVNIAQANYRYARDGKPYSDFTSQFATLTTTISSDPFDITSITGFYHFRQYDLNNVSGESYPATFTQRADFKQFSEEVRAQSHFDGPLNVLLGAFWNHGDFSFNTDAWIVPFVPINPATGTYTTFKRDNGFKTDAMSFFAQATLNVTDQLELSAGGRYSLESRDSFQRSLDANGFVPGFPGGLNVRDKYNDDNFSPEVTLRYKPVDDMTFYASYKQGFKAGGYNISQVLSAASASAFNAEATRNLGRFGAEKAKGGEAGFKGLLFDRRLLLNLTVYHYSYTDLQVQFFDPTTVSLTAGNAGKLRTQGVEGDFNFRVPGVEGFSIRGAAAYNDAKFKDYIGQCYSGQTAAQGCNQVSGTSQNYDGRTPPKAPKFAGRLGATLDVPLASSGMAIRLSGDGSYTSSYNFTDALRPDAIQKAYAKLDAAIALRGPEERWTLSLIGRNLTNKLVVTSANDLPFAGGTPGVTADMSAFVDNPREVFVEVAFKF